MLKFKTILLYLLFSNFVFSQTDFQKSETELARYNDWFVNSDKLDHRKFALEKFNELFLTTLSSKNSFDFPFDSLKWISKQMPADSSFRLFSWQLMKSKTEFEYFGLIQTKENLFILKDNKWKSYNIEYEIFTPSNWYGQIYYNLHQIAINDKPEYLVFGLKILPNDIKIKTVESLYFDNGLPRFGKGIFEDTLNKKMLKNRVVLLTSLESNSRLMIDNELDMIIFDHTIVIPSSYEPNAKQLIVADGTYHGYKLKNNIWKFIDNVFPQKYDKPPMLDQEKSK
jgi:hypothetical protein